MHNKWYATDDELWSCWETPAVEFDATMSAAQVNSAISDKKHIQTSMHVIFFAKSMGFLAVEVYS